MSCNNLTHARLVDLALRWMLGKGMKIAFTELTAWTYTGEVPDVLGFTSGRSMLIEVKVTRSDFLSDKKKKFRAMPQFGMGDERYYFAPVGLIHPKELPTDWGLVEYYPDTGKTRTKVYAGRIGANMAEERRFLYSVARRAQLRCGLDPCKCREELP